MSHSEKKYARSEAAFIHTVQLNSSLGVTCENSAVKRNACACNVCGHSEDWVGGLRTLTAEGVVAFRRLVFQSFWQTSGCSLRYSRSAGNILCSTDRRPAHPATHSP